MKNKYVRCKFCEELLYVYKHRHNKMNLSSQMFFAKKQAIIRNTDNEFALCISCNKYFTHSHKTIVKNYKSLLLCKNKRINSLF
ncbi:hypothetical protein [Perigonia lusca single nucleopolyhedrovirus]|uniref:Ac43-like protein n=1 Tax=Perigonia lusca single nucleopolyhedrovirus TaxID=1675865 RepID=A0A0M3N034_9ABAC|nr:hypothetical protein [Perigonia lusca single nucleopolyhedrovirus]AKN80569.1 hypothetical protein [Perigonia lusca single nucleopolyhedrovirus]